MNCIRDQRRRRIGIVTGSVAFLTGLSLYLFAVSPIYSQVVPRSVVCYQNSATTLRTGAALTMQENPMENRRVSRGNVTSWSWPVNGAKSSDYGWRNGDFHHGVDIATPSGSLIRAARAGQVAKTGWLGVYGLAVLVDHGNGVQTLYAHNSKLLVKVGDRVKGGEEIALSGNTGNSTGPHLHFEIRINRQTVDPDYYLMKT